MVELVAGAVVDEAANSITGFDVVVVAGSADACTPADPTLAKVNRTSITLLPSTVARIV